MHRVDPIPDQVPISTMFCTSSRAASFSKYAPRISLAVISASFATSYLSHRLRSQVRLSNIKCFRSHYSTVFVASWRSPRAPRLVECQPRRTRGNLWSFLRRPISLPEHRNLQRGWRSYLRHLRKLCDHKLLPQEPSIDFWVSFSLLSLSLLLSLPPRRSFGDMCVGAYQAMTVPPIHQPAHADPQGGLFRHRPLLHVRDARNVLHVDDAHYPAKELHPAVACGLVEKSRNRGSPECRKRLRTSVGVPVPCRHEATMPV